MKCQHCQKKFERGKMEFNDKNHPICPFCKKEI